ncbi:DUF2891 family protein [Arthrobacter woluwensis]|uniref:DUF2891 family protein n=1 Tax=Arthrobacter woluwensis TaxID=156980 RepID=UPI001AAFE98B|nr:DUF2891 family protein [Arthrobacter woluwensis]QTF72999.1 DUF2891 family protein [Arthrobacter woluwensis]
MTDTFFPGAAQHCADVVLDNLGRPYPYASHHVERSETDLHTPAELHPAFHTSFDWHSCVHMHWLGVSVLDAALRGEADLDAGTAAALRAALGANLTAAKLAVEADYLRANPSWERPYGWAWLVRLAAACHASQDPEIAAWGRNLDGCVDVVAELVQAWTATVEHPVRHGLHTNSAFGLSYLLTAFRDLGRDDAAQACERAAVRWFGEDRAWATEWELSGQDFLSAGLSEADLLQRVLPADEFAVWLEGFLPGLTAESRMLATVGVADESDGYMVHLHGLNLTRAGQLARVVAALDAPAEGRPDARPGTPQDLRAVLDAAVEPLFEAGMHGLQSGDFMSTHWLASFAWDARESIGRLRSVTA